MSKDADEDKRTAVETMASLRHVAASYPDHPGQRFLDDLRARSPRFAGLWDTRHMAERRSRRKTVDHPLHGRLVLDCDALHLPVDQRLIVYSAASGTPEAEALALVRVVGLQDLQVTAQG